ncbi:MAG: HlyD family efflux transporter periplasmic adaptor subunit [Zoogloeaceae bacterium]|jgi:multidrug resistance efflux pump|nr:HlyD family efflux transporter periplasmic adaptor subunit [Zoogloeaceae bacterium]
MKIQFDVPPLSAEKSRGVPVKYPDGKRHVPRWRWWLLLAAILALPLFFLLRMGWGFLDKRSPATVMVEQIVLRAPVSAQIQDIVGENVLVQGGAILVKLVQHDVDTPPVETESLQSALSLAQERLRIMALELRRRESLERQGAATRQEVESARLQWIEAQKEMGVAQRDLAANTIRRPDATMELLSPAPAIVIRNFARQGEWVQAGEELLVLQTPNAPWIQAFLSPEQMEFATPGQEATLLFMNGYRAAAVVEKILPEIQRLPSERVSPLEAQSSAIVVRLKPLAPLPPELSIHRLPLDVRFTPTWP